MKIFNLTKRLRIPPEPFLCGGTIYTQCTSNPNFSTAFLPLVGKDRMSMIQKNHPYSPSLLYRAGVEKQSGGLFFADRRRLVSLSFWQRPQQENLPVSC